MQTVIDGVLTHYELINPKAKSPVIILHGWGQSSSHWLSLANQLSSNFRLYLLDLPGFGGTKNLPRDSDVPHYSEFVKKFATKINLKRFTLVGHSFGGQIATDIALKYSGKLNRLVLIDSATVRIRGPKVILKIALTKIIKPLIKRLPVHLVNGILSLYAPPEYVQANDFQKSVLHHILKYNLRPQLHLIKVPTNIIWGSEDHVIPYVGKQLVETIPHSSLHLIYGAGHLPHLTHTVKLATVLNQVLSENEPT